MRSIWIYALKEELTPELANSLKSHLNSFLVSWQSHGDNVNGAADVKHNRFVVVNTLPGPISGCSIDSMNQKVSEILEEHNLEHVPANFIFYRTASGQLECFDFRETDALVNEGKITPDTIFFDNSIQDFAEFGNWEKKMGTSWMSRHFKSAVQS